MAQLKVYQNEEQKKLAVNYSPRGIARYPHLHKPDTKFVSAGVYKTGLILDPTENAADAEFVEQLNEMAQWAYDKAVSELKSKKKHKQAKELTLHVPVEEEFDDDGEETGRVIVGDFKMNAKVFNKDDTLKFEQSPDMADGRGKPIKKLIRVNGGSTIKIAFQLVPFHNAAASNAGVSLRLKAVQIIEQAQSEASYSGFGDEGGDQFADEEEETGSGFSDEGGDEADDQDDPEDF